MSFKEKLTNKKQKMARGIIEGVTVAQSTMNEVDDAKVNKAKCKVLKVYNMTLVGLMCIMATGMCFAEDPAAEVIQKMIGIICKVFRYVGVVLAVYSVGQLVMAFKNEDADSKSRATTMLVVAGILVGIDQLVEGLNLTSYLTGNNTPS